MRVLLRETHISLSDLIHPLFIEEHITHAAPISTLPGISRLPRVDLRMKCANFTPSGSAM